MAYYPRVIDLPEMGHVSEQIDRYGHLFQAASRGDFPYLRLHEEEFRRENARFNTFPLYETFIAAAKGGFLEIVQHLLTTYRDHLDFNLQADTAFFWAAKNGHLAIVAYFLDNGAHVDVMNAAALRAAAEYAHWDVVRYLISYRERTQPHALTSFICCVNSEVFRNAARHGSLEMVKFLLTKEGEKANIDDLDSSGHSALMEAIRGDHLEVARYLLAKGADVSPCFQGALWIAVAHRHFELVRYLLERTDGPPADITEPHHLALKWSIWTRNFEIFDYLISKGESVAHLDESELRIVEEHRPAVLP